MLFFVCFTICIVNKKIKNKNLSYAYSYLFDFEDEDKRLKIERKFRDRVNIHMAFWHNVADKSRFPSIPPFSSLSNTINPKSLN